MDLQAHKNGAPDSNPDLESTGDFKTPVFPEDPDSTCSTPYVSAPSSPGRGPVNVGFYYSCPASPMHFAVTATAACLSAKSSPDGNGGGSSLSLGYEFEFSARFGSSGSGQQGSMSSADELFLNGQIRPMKLSTHLEKPQVLTPLLDLEEEEDEEELIAMEVKNEGKMSTRGRDLRLRDKSLRRRTRSLSPLRSTSFEFGGGGDDNDSNSDDEDIAKNVKTETIEVSGTEGNVKDEEEERMGASRSASSSRSSSAGRSSNRWVFLKDFLYRSKSEGRSNNKFWSNISFSPSKDKKPITTTTTTLQQQQQHSCPVSKEKAKSINNNNVRKVKLESKKSGQRQGKKTMNGVGKRRVPSSAAPSPHELHYKSIRAQAEEMRKKTFLPYRQGLLGCLGFSSKSYGAMNGFARSLNPVSSR